MFGLGWIRTWWNGTAVEEPEKVSQKSAESAITKPNGDENRSASEASVPTSLTTATSEEKSEISATSGGKNKLGLAMSKLVSDSGKGEIPVFSDEEIGSGLALRELYRMAGGDVVRPLSDEEINSGLALLKLFWGMGEDVKPEESVPSTKVQDFMKASSSPHRNRLIAASPTPNVAPSILDEFEEDEHKIKMGKSILYI